MAYVEGFVVPVPRDKLDAYKEMSRAVEIIFRENGALDYVECVGDDVPYGTFTSFPRAVQAKEDVTARQLAFEGGARSSRCHNRHAFLALVGCRACVNRRF